MMSLDVLAAQRLELLSLSPRVLREALRPDVARLAVEGRLDCVRNLQRLVRPEELVQLDDDELQAVVAGQPLVAHEVGGCSRLTSQLAQHRRALLLASQPCRASP